MFTSVTWLTGGERRKVIDDVTANVTAFDAAADRSRARHES
jgi:hypothetical protein